MSNNKFNPNDIPQEVTDEIHAVKVQFQEMLVSQQTAIKRMGEALQKVFADKPQVICTHIKYLLRDEITQGAITERRIEQLCPPEWKNPTKAQAGLEGARATAERNSAEIPITVSVGGGNAIDDGDRQEVNKSNPYVEQRMNELAEKVGGLQTKLDSFMSIVQTAKAISCECDTCKMARAFTG